jgi:hypothetical protein
MTIISQVHSSYTRRAEHHSEAIHSFPLSIVCRSIIMDEQQNAHGCMSCLCNIISLQTSATLDTHLSFEMTATIYQQELTLVIRFKTQKAMPNGGRFSSTRWCQKQIFMFKVDKSRFKLY